MLLQRLNSKANLRKTSSGDLPYQTSYPVIARYEADSTASQTLINMTFSVDQANKESFQLFIDGKLLREGSSNDFTFTSIQADNTSSQITLSSPIDANLNIVAIKLGVRVDSLSSGGSVISSGGSKNYFSLNNANPDFEKNLTSPWLPCTLTWSGTAPSGAPTLTATNMTLSVSNSNPLSGSYSMLLTKAAANAQYQGFISDELTIDREDVAKVLYGSFSYELVSGTVDFSGTSTQTYEIWIYNTVAGTWTQPAGYRGMNQSSGVGKVVFSFQTDGTFANNSYRIAVITQQTGTGAIVVKFDDFSVGPEAIVLGTPVTDWQDRGVITIGATTTAPTKGTAITDKVWMRRVGDSGEFVYQYAQTTAGTSGSGSYLFSLPSGMSFDTTKLTTSASVILDAAGSGVTTLGTAVISVSIFGRVATGIVVPYNSTQFYVYIATSQDTSGSGEASVDEAFGTSSSTYLMGDNTLGFKFMFKAPIAGWSSNVQTSSDIDTRVVACSVKSTVSLSTTAGATVKPQTLDFDTHGTYSLANGVYTCPVSGIYKVSVADFEANSGVANATVIYKNGSAFKTIEFLNGTSTVQNGSPIVSASLLVQCNSGDTLSVVIEGTVGLFASGTRGPAIQYQRISGPSVITATETVAAKYSGTVSATVSTTAPIQWNTKQFDTHNAVTTGASWRFTAPVSGIYRVSSIAFTTGASVGVGIYKNGSSSPSRFGDVNAVYSIPGSSTISLIAGDYIDIRTYSSSATIAADIQSNICIERIGNYA